MDNWVSIYSTSQQFMAEMVQGVLADNDIEAVILNQQDSSYLIGEIEVFVHKDNQEKAVSIIKTIKE